MKLKQLRRLLMLLLSVFVLTGCQVEDVLRELTENSPAENAVEETMTLADLTATDHFRDGALAHILEGELNGRGQAVGFHYDGLPSKKGEIIPGTKTPPNALGVYEAEVTVSDVKKTSNRGQSSFFPDAWSAQGVVDAINDAYEHRSHITGNTYEGLTQDGVVIRMYLDQQERIISAFPVY